MHLQIEVILQAAILLLIWIDSPIAYGQETYDTTYCPIGYSIFFTKSKNTPYCFRRKGPETFADKYKDCAGNLYTSKLYNEMNITKPDYVIWTEYKSMHPGGLFVDWSNTKTIGDKFDAVYDVTIDPTLDLEEELCLVIDPVSNYTAVKCNEQQYSFCVIKAYDYKDNTKGEGCEGLKDSLRFWSPESTCLSALTGVGGGAVRATWNQAQDLCTKKGGSLLNRGWRLSNYPMFRNSGINYTYPLGIVMSSDYSLLRYDATNDHSEIPLGEWNFQNFFYYNDTLFGSLHNDIWNLVNSSYIFYDVICEHSVPLEDLTLDVAIDLENKLTLITNDTLSGDDIYCFTDSVNRYPVKINKKRVDETNEFILKPKDDGYYWCTHINTKKYTVKESKKVLFVREKQSLINVYAIKLKNNKLYKLDDLPKLFKVWEAKLKEYIFYRTKYINVYGEINSNITEDVLKSFKNSVFVQNEKTVILKMKLKRLYMDRRTVLVHVELSPDMKPVTPGFWDQMEILSMKPVFYCKGFDTIPQMALGESFDTAACRTHTCVGNFNEGVQWVTTAKANCTTYVGIDKTFRMQDDGIAIVMPSVVPSSTTISLPILDDSDSSEEIYESITDDIIKTSTTLADYRSNVTSETETDEPTTTNATISTTDITVDSTTDSVGLTSDKDKPCTETTTSPPSSTSSTPIVRPPEEQLEQVLQDLDRLVNNGSTPVMVEDIDDVFNQVDDILQVHDTLEIPGQLLHLLDRLGSAIELNGSRSAAAVRGNIALLMADANPGHPVRGLKIANRDTDVFTDDAFEIISTVPNSTVLDSENNEVVVHLPQSVSETSHRISFVVFRNDRAFQPNEGLYSVNSRVLSIKVGEVTQFENGEVIDIHLSPLTVDPIRNQSRTCAYWEFLNNGSGYWSQEGCTLIRATQPGMLDTCRCTHLTHFAEVLFPRSVFSQKDEDILELLTIIGCCLSLFGLIFVGVTAAIFRSWRRDFNNKIWLQLCIAIFMVALSFLIVIFAKFDQCNVFCMLTGIVLHYSVLASFCWMLVAAVLSYRRLVLVFTRDASHKLLRASAFSWGAPCAVIGVLLSINPQSYAGPFEEKTPSTSFCYPSGLGLWLAVYAPIALILLVNWTLFFLIVRSVFASRGIQRHGDTNEALRCASVSCLLVFLFGLPWIFGLFAYNVVAAYFFTLTATYQGLMLFLFFVLGNKKTRDLWLNKLKIKQTRKVPVTSSTYSNRSTGWRGGTQGMNFEAKASKPKSLAQDDSRFS
ncbi:uncharacterized protein LOC113404752 isoform X1 [Vanessa tameamea]|uniref:Uncharacterized protein LOC113404752 isoform X1 n=1 Tax=Vanessa tameamea TaxID=334116 RepID=A0ABM4AKF5_VANTA